jgi:hypothetical protein
MRLLALFAAFALASCGCVGPPQPENVPPATTLYDCGASEGAVRAQLDAAAACSSDRDCTIVYGFGCPFGCWSLVNRGSDLAAINRSSEEYHASCGECRYKCMHPPFREEIRCVAGRCGEVRLNITVPPTVPSTTTTQPPASCGAAKEKLIAVLSAAARCSSGADCEVASDLRRCGATPCFSLINRAVDKAALADALAGYDSSCEPAPCNVACIRAPAANETACYAGLCSDMRSTPTTLPPTYTGKIRGCEYTMRPSCGKCYCVETPQGCEIADYSAVGDISAFVNKTVRYQAQTQGHFCSRMCPCQIKLTAVEAA